jgi:hypothetical protein
MEITIKKTIEEKKQINLPAYYKSLASIVKIFSEDYCLLVTHSDNHLDIGLKHAELPFNVGMVECTKEEFEQAYKEVSLKLQSINDGNN